MGGEERSSGDREKRGEEVDAGSLFVLKSKGTYYSESYTGSEMKSRVRCILTYIYYILP